MRFPLSMIAAFMIQSFLCIIVLNMLDLLDARLMKEQTDFLKLVINKSWMKFELLALGK